MQAKVYLVGNLTKEPEISETPSGIKTVKMDVAVNYGYGDSKIVDYFRVIAWRSIAENCGKYLKKGSKVAVDGLLSNRSYKDKNGNERTVTEITVVQIDFLSTDKKAQAEPEAPKQEQTTFFEVNDGDLPF